jgi:hypothetical protein
MGLDGELRIYTRGSLTNSHLGHAFDLLHSARSAGADKANAQASELSHRYAISSIIHAYASLESQINHVGYEMFFQERSKRYVPIDKRSFVLRRFVQSWNNTPCIDKLLYLVTEPGSTPFPEPLNQQLRELNTLRNWLVHGFSYTTTDLVLPLGTHSWDVVDTEDNVSWLSKFPQTKFRSPDSLSSKEATLSLRIVLEALELLSNTLDLPIFFCTITSGMRPNIIYRDKSNLAAALAILNA